jgi:transposase
MEEAPEWFVGIDWASATHRVRLLDGTGRCVGERDVPHDGAGLAQLCDWLRATTGAPAGRIAVAIEVPHGPVVEALLEQGFAVFALNPKQLDRFRDRFTVAGAKDDSRDAHVLGDAVRTDRHAFRRLSAEDPAVIELREFSRLLDDLQQERQRLTNRMRELLWRYYPQMLELADDLGAEWLLELWRQAPTPARAARVREATVARILKAHRIRKFDAAGVLRILRQKPLVVAPGTAEAACGHIETLIARLQLVNRQIKAVHRRIDALCERLGAGTEDASGQPFEQRDVAILRSCPGLGRITLATLLAEAPEPVRRRDYDALRTLSGVAPVTRRSGKSCIVVRRLACNKRLRNAVYHWARVAIQHDPASRQRYGGLRRRGKSHGHALRAVADRLLHVLCALLRGQTLFDPDYRSTASLAAAA